MIELLQIVLWFNPIIFWLKKAVQLNHEFLADDSVVSSHHNISYYQTLLINKAAWNNKFYLASNLNYLVTKKRLLMMKTPSSKLSILLKKLAILPLMVGFVFAFANRAEAQTKDNPTVKEVKKEEKKSATEAQIKEYNKLLEYAEKTKMFKFDEIKRLRYLYSLMSDVQKKSVKNINDYIPPPPPPPAKVIIKEFKEKKVNKDDKKSKEEKEVEEEVEIEIKKKKELIPNEIEEIVEVEILDEKYEKNIVEEIELEISDESAVTYYINGKKTSKKKAKELLKTPSKVKSIDVIKKIKIKGK